MRLLTLRMKRSGQHLFVQKCFSSKRSDGYLNSLYDVEYFQGDENYIESIFNHEDFVEWYAIRYGTTLIPSGRRGNELKFLVPNRWNSKRYKVY